MSYEAGTAARSTSQPITQLMFGDLHSHLEAQVAGTSFLSMDAGLYVGMTRAQQRLILTAAQRRTLAGRTVENRPCPFLDDLPADLLATSRAAPRRRKARQLSLLR
jgi:hypothetical protein